MYATEEIMKLSELWHDTLAYLLGMQYNSAFRFMETLAHVIFFFIRMDSDNVSIKGILNSKHNYHKQDKKDIKFLNEK